jgi:hypothetical protein
MVGMPTRWGSVKLRGVPGLPVYVVKFVRSFSDPPTAFCRPPSCIVMDWVNITQLMRSCDRYGGQAYIYDALVAVQSGYTIREGLVSSTHTPLPIQATDTTHPRRYTSPWAPSTWQL